MAAFGSVRTAAAAALVAVAITATTAGSPAPAAAAGGTGELTLLSTSSSGTKADRGTSGILSVSADGSVVVFESQNSTNLVPGLTNYAQVYAKDVVSGTTTVISAAADGTPGNGFSWQARVSSNGRYVAFISKATNLHPDDTDGNDDVFVKDRLTGAVMLATTDANGDKGAGTWASGPPRVSNDGETVVFAYNAGLVDEYVGGVEFYAKNLVTGAVTMLTDPSIVAGGTAGTVSLDLTADGSTAVVNTFESLTADDIEDAPRPDVFAVDTTTGAATLVSIPLGGETDTVSAAYFPSISDDGTRVVYQGIHRGVNSSTQIQVWSKDLTTGNLTLVSAGANGLSQDPEISPDGGFVVYASNGTNLVSGDTNGVSDVFLEDLATGEVVLVSRTDAGTLANSYTFIGVPTNEGRSVFFQNAATNLSPLDTDVYDDIYRKVLPVPVPPDSDGDGIADDVDPDPGTPSSGFADGSGTNGDVLSNGTGAPVSIVDLPAPGGVRITTGGTTGQVTVKACGGFTLRVPAGSQIDLACGSIIITVGPGGPLVIEVDGEKELSIEIPSGVSVRVSTPVNDDFTVEYLSGSQPVIVREPSEPWDFDYPSPRETWISSGTRSFTTNLPPTVDSVSLSTANVVIGQQVELTATFSDPGVDDTHTCAVTWASGVTVPGTVSAGQCTSSHSYGALGLNNVIVRVTDDAGDAGSGGASVLVYDPDTYWTYDPSSSFGGAGGGIDVDPVSQDVWITGNNKVAKYSSDGTLQFEVGGFGTAPGLFNGASALAVHPSTGDVYVTDVGGNRIQQFDSSGNFVRAFGAGAGTAFDNPLGIDVDADGYVWVADVYNGKLQKFTSTGTYVSTLGGTGSAPFAVSVDPDGNVWVSDFDGSRDRVHKINPATGQRELTITGLGQPVDITFDDRGQVHIANFNAKEIRTYTLTGGVVASRPMPVLEGNGWYSQPYPSRMAISGEGRLLVTNSVKVAVFDPPTPPDTDGDGIPDAIDCDPDAVTVQFCDGVHTGEVISNGTGEPLTFVDLPGSEGVKVIVGGAPGTQAKIRLCGGFTMTVSAGNEVNVTCGSVTVEVITGGSVILTPESGDGVTTVAIPQGVRARIATVDGDSFTVEYKAGTAPVIVEVNGVVTNVDQDTGDLDFSANVAPVIDAVAAPNAPVSLAQQPVAVSASFTDPGATDSHTCAVDWGDGADDGGNRRRAGVLGDAPLRRGRRLHRRGHHHRRRRRLRQRHGTGRGLRPRRRVRDRRWLVRVASGRLHGCAGTRRQGHVRFRVQVQEGRFGADREHTVPVHGRRPRLQVHAVRVDGRHRRQGRQLQRQRHDQRHGRLQVHDLDR